MRLTFALKTGDRVYYYADENISLDGATRFSITEETTEITLVFANRKEGDPQ